MDIMYILSMVSVEILLGIEAEPEKPLETLGKNQWLVVRPLEVGNPTCSFRHNTFYPYRYKYWKTLLKEL